MPPAVALGVAKRARADVGNSHVDLAAVALERSEHRVVGSLAAHESLGRVDMPRVLDPDGSKAGPGQKDHFARPLVVAAAIILDVDLPSQVSGADHRSPAAAQPLASWIAGTIRISAADLSNWRIADVRPGPSSRNASRPGGEMLGERRLRRRRPSRVVLVPLGQRQVAVPRLEQPEFRHEGALLPSSFRDHPAASRTSIVDRPAGRAILIEIDHRDDREADLNRTARSRPPGSRDKVAKPLARRRVSRPLAARLRSWDGACRTFPGRSCLAWTACHLFPSVHSEISYRTFFVIRLSFRSYPIRMMKSLTFVVSRARHRFRREEIRVWPVASWLCCEPSRPRPAAFWPVAAETSAPPGRHPAAAVERRRRSRNPGRQPAAGPGTATPAQSRRWRSHPSRQR